MGILTLQRELQLSGMRSTNGFGIARAASEAVIATTDFMERAVIQQPKSMDCWITSITMMYSWRRSQSISVDAIAQELGEPWQGFYTGNSGLFPRDEADLLRVTGLVGEFGQSFPLSAFAQMLRDYGPLIFNQANSTAPGNNWGMHMRILIKMVGDGSEGGTTMILADPANGRIVRESYQVFIEKYEREIREDGSTRNVILHWPSGIRERDRQRTSHGKSIEMVDALTRAVSMGLLQQHEARAFMLQHLGSGGFATAQAALTEVHLEGSRLVDRGNGNRARKLNEPGMPIRTDITSAPQLTTIVEWLDVENRGHNRYQPSHGNTYCNIYAYDYCALAGAYCPRVFWDANAIRNIQADQEVTARYGETIVELSANGLERWFRNHGGEFGWVVPTSLDRMQSWVNRGAVGVIVGQKNPHGHITVVVPETDAHRAERDATSNLVTSPLQSQAGARNLKYHTNKWWTNHEPKGFYLWLGKSVPNEEL